MQTRILTAAMTALMFVVPGMASAGHASTRPATLRLQHAAPSVDALLDQFVKALARRDEQALHRLRVNEQEYRRIIIPGTVKPGEPPRQVAEEPSQFFWSMLNQKSEDVARTFLEQYGGHTLKRKNVSFTKGTRQFAWYTALGDVRLTLEDESGQVRELGTGTIAEIDGRYKFIGFNTNN